MAIIIRTKPTYHKAHIEFLPDGSTRRTDPPDCPDCYDVRVEETHLVHKRVDMAQEHLEELYSYRPGLTLIKCGGLIDDDTLAVHGPALGTSENRDAFYAANADTHCPDCWLSQISVQTVVRYDTGR